MPPHPTLFLRKEVYNKHGLFDTTFKIAGDYDFMLRVMTDPAMNLRYLPEVITRMRLGGVLFTSFIDPPVKTGGYCFYTPLGWFPLAILAAKNLHNCCTGNP